MQLSEDLEDLMKDTQVVTCFGLNTKLDILRRGIGAIRVFK
jgi:hypothetical protein